MRREQRDVVHSEVFNVLSVSHSFNPDPSPPKHTTHVSPQQLLQRYRKCRQYDPVGRVESAQTLLHSHHTFHHDDDDAATAASSTFCCSTSSFFFCFFFFFFLALALVYGLLSM